MINDIKVFETGLFLLSLLMIAAVFWWYLNYWPSYTRTYASRKEELVQLLKDVGVLVAILVGFFLLVVLWLSLAGPEVRILCADCPTAFTSP